MDFVQLHLLKSVAKGGTRKVYDMEEVSVPRVGDTITLRGVEHVVTKVVWPCVPLDDSDVGLFVFDPVKVYAEGP